MVDPSTEDRFTVFLLKEPVDPRESPEIGRIYFKISTDDLFVSDACLDGEYHGQGLGSAMYLAGYAYAHHVLGAKRVVGVGPSEDAMGVHRRLSRKTGKRMRTEWIGDDVEGYDMRYSYPLASEFLNALRPPAPKATKAAKKGRYRR